MGMTIEDSIDLFADNFTAINTHGHYTEEEEAQVIETAISTMRKYQKIQEIVNSNPDYIHHTDMDTYKLNSIREVIEDGND